MAASGAKPLLRPAGTMKATGMGQKLGILTGADENGILPPDSFIGVLRIPIFSYILGIQTGADGNGNAHV